MYILYYILAYYARSASSTLSRPITLGVIRATNYRGDFYYFYYSTVIKFHRWENDPFSILEMKNFFEIIVIIPGNNWVKGRIDGALITVTKEEDFSGGQLLNVAFIGICPIFLTARSTPSSVLYVTTTVASIVYDGQSPSTLTTVLLEWLSSENRVKNSTRG